MLFEHQILCKTVHCTRTQSVPRNILVQTKPMYIKKCGTQSRQIEKSLLIQILKVDLCDRKPFGSDLNDRATDTGGFTVC